MTDFNSVSTGNSTSTAPQSSTTTEKNETSSHLTATARVLAEPSTAERLMSQPSVTDQLRGNTELSGEQLANDPTVIAEVIARQPPTQDSKQSQSLAVSQKTGTIFDYLPKIPELNQSANVNHYTAIKGYADYIQKASRLEQTAQSDGYTNNQITSSFRKIYYDSNHWDTAIAGAANTGTPPSWQVQSPSVEGDLEHIQEQWDLGANQEININGVEVDLGHMWTGLDASNHENGFAIERMGMDIFSFRSNKEFSTYVGDLGSVVESYVDKKSSLSDPATLQNIYTELAGDADMAGNADAYAISKQYDPKISPVMNLRNYYEGNVNIAGNKVPPASDHRYTTFAQEIGLGSLQGNGKLSGDTPEFREALRGEISSFAEAFQFRNGKMEGITTWGGLLHYNRVSERVVDMFITDMTDKVAHE